MSGPLALVGSGEFLPVMEAVDRGLLEGRGGRVVHLPTAAAPEGPETVGRWTGLAREHYARLGVDVVTVRVLERRDADDAGLADQIAGAALVYLSGGNPAYLARTLLGTRVAAALEAAWRGGSALAGCSAGAIALTPLAPDLRGGGEALGLGLVPHLAVLPHHDRFRSWRPDLAERMLERLGPGMVLVGVDEDTALVGGLDTWEVQGRQQVWVYGPPDGPVPHASGTVLELPRP